MLSPLPNMRLWHATSGEYSFVISLEQEQGDPDWTGYMASWKNTRTDMRPFGRQPANIVDGGPWRTLAEAEAACDQALKQLRDK